MSKTNNNNNSDTTLLVTPALLGRNKLLDLATDYSSLILTNTKCDPDAIPLPRTQDEFNQNQPLPFPAQWPYLMLNMSVSGVTELDNDIIINKNRKEINVQPLIEPLPDAEWIHVLFHHPRHDDFNNWRKHFMHAPTLYERSKLLALRRLQKEYTDLLIMKRKNDLETLEQFDRVELEMHLHF